MLTTSHPAWRSRAIAVLVAMAAAVATAFLLQGAPEGASASASSSSSSAPATLGGIAQTDPARQVEVIVQFADQRAFAGGAELVRNSGGTITRNLHVIDGYAARMSAGAADRLLDNPNVVNVSLNQAVETSSASIADATRTSFLESVGLDRRWRGRNSGYTGKGVTVAVVDTGIAGAVPDFRTSSTDATSRVVASVVTNPDATTEDDTYGHGTHVAGLIAGNGTNRPAGDPLRGKYVGTAPDANLVSVKVSDDHGATSLIDVIYGLQFVVDHKDDYGIRVVNLSLSAATAESYKTDPLDAAVESAWMHGIVVVAAAGNRGTASDAVSYAPGNDPYVITVGGVDTMGTKRTSDDALASWSSRGVTQDGVAKPEVVVPGAHIVGPYAPGSDFGQLCPTCIVDGQYFKVGGTSMSAGIVSGIVAGLLEAHPDWTPDQVKGALANNLRRMADGKFEVDADKAADAKRKELVSNAGLTPNELVNATTGDIDYDRASWSRASWSQVEGDRASWSRASWSRASWSRASWSCDCMVAVTGEADPDRASWSRASWSRASWSRASWSRASWSASFSK
ncbi:MAG: S8 family peptidase [Solirubrobacteraceae bacterium]